MKRFFAVLLVVWLLATTRSLVFAADPNAKTSFEMCEVASGQAKTDCEACLSKDGVFTAVGCIRFDPAGFAVDFMKVALGVSGGIALLLLLYGSFLLSVSAGDPKKAQQGQEIISGTIAGLLFIIFSGLLMKLIGIDILDLPGL